MNNFIFKSANRLIKNDSIPQLGHLIDLVLKEQRHQRSDLHDIKLMLNKLLIDKHLQHQVDKYFEDDPAAKPPELEDIPEDKD